METYTKVASFGDIIKVIIKDGSTTIVKAKGAVGEILEIGIKYPKLWLPESPLLYNLEVSLYNQGRLQDKVKSYAAIRKVSTKRDENSIIRLQLNNKDYFQFGPLDQSWWPNGLYTAPTDEALVYDIQKTKDLGFNMIRKHVKVESARWYTYCDWLGILMWQDMPNGDRSPQWQSRQYFNETEMVHTEESEASFSKEWKEIMEYLYYYPCIVT